MVLMEHNLTTYVQNIMGHMIKNHKLVKAGIQSAVNTWICNQEDLQKKHTEHKLHISFFSLDSVGNICLPQRIFSKLHLRYGQKGMHIFM
jgi:hypothetical protein